MLSVGGPEAHWLGRDGALHGMFSIHSPSGS